MTKNPDKLSIVIGSDSVGYDFKNQLKVALEADPRIDILIDEGAKPDESIRYANVAERSVQKVLTGEADRALLICGTGLGMAISANKVAGIRAVTAHDIYSVERSVLSNDAQVLCMGARVIGVELAKRLIDRWLDLRFDPESHSAANVDAICSVESHNLARKIR
ncbi:MAG: RpiB/LacA/LacB family sugar-phosphate isomerase [Ancrocorticia sp.]|jgi:ribose 5-phosphate isomerase B|nr:RpiB/LacA/LacB family sugar-phosphate isomerase [Ancrocorticia sp.]MCI1964433.1 RpiB/LacA/LacB family sugar-phosphate isomerase [Ancrocorticia sp.]MCI2002244.1 RpiB/LacA/LacB family sugar-phosphate isomerase [Ancrocorticia sp.]MCI2179238.1 RpiB/LacA/LacB family sugar-phosphate isomerase [Ancrocorticia sp.]MCI2194384.1 RpiB/LacA/LacB family sugar-phosphate isomerase [Ancrocorticia sp.]